MRFTSRWPTTKTAATAMEASPRTMSASEAKAPSPAAAQTASARASATKPTLVTPPARSAPSSPGASP